MVGGMKNITWLDGAWFEGNRAMLGPLTQATWLGGVIFDGARSFEGKAPDLDLHCARAIRSCAVLGLKAVVPAARIVELAREGIDRFDGKTALYIRPLFWAEDGVVDPDPESTRFALTVFEAPLPPPNGFSAGLSTCRRPAPDMAPTDAKATCLYPQSGRAAREVKARGFDDAVMLDPDGHVAEFASSNLFLARAGEVHTPVPNRTFLNGITRQRVIGLLRDAGVKVHERSVSPEELTTADEIFSTGNYSKVIPLTRYEDRAVQPGPMYRLARDLYWKYAHRHG